LTGRNAGFSSALRENPPKAGKMDRQRESQQRFLSIKNRLKRKSGPINEHQPHLRDIIKGTGKKMQTTKNAKRKNY